MTQSADIFVDYPYELFSFMREIRKPVFHNSNVFLRDVQYAIQSYFEDREGVTLRGDAVEAMAKEVARGLEAKGIFKRVNPQGYLLIYPEMLTGKDGTKGPLMGGKPVMMPPPAAATAAPAKAAAPAAKPAAAPVAAKPAAPAAAPTTGGVPSGAKAPPPWLKK
jgi:hypothetical protein